MAVSILISMSTYMILWTVRSQIYISILLEVLFFISSKSQHLGPEFGILPYNICSYGPYTPLGLSKRKCLVYSSISIELVLKKTTFTYGAGTLKSDNR